MTHCCGCMAISTAGIMNAKKWRDPELDRIIDVIKKAGGNVNAEVLITLVWDSRSDLDMHLYVPEQLGDGNQIGNVTGEIYYKNHNIHKGHDKWNSGYLDIDANAQGAMMEHPVENIAFDNVNEMPDGNYLFSVQNFNSREGRGNNKCTILVAFKNEGESDFTKALIMNSKFSLDIDAQADIRGDRFFDIFKFKVTTAQTGKDVKITWLNSGGFEIVYANDIVFAEGVRLQ